MPNRIIREGWLESEPINTLGPAEEVFFLRLCLRADDFGRYHGNPTLLRSNLFPLRDDLRNTDIPRWLAACEKAGLIRCYEVAGKRYLEIQKFDQRTRARVSKFPAPPGWKPPDDGQMSDTCQTDARHSRTETETESKTESPKPPAAEPPGARDRVFNPVFPLETARILDEIDRLAGTDFRSVPGQADVIEKILKTGVSEDRIMAMLRHRWSVWKGSDMVRFFRPATLFRPEKFESYLGAVPASKPVNSAGQTVIVPTPEEEQRMAAHYRLREALAGEVALTGAALRLAVADLTALRAVGELPVDIASGLSQHPEVLEQLRKAA